MEGTVFVSGTFTDTTDSRFHLLFILIIFVLKFGSKFFIVPSINRLLFNSLMFKYWQVYFCLKDLFWFT